jgi:hypothetical protein
MKSARPIQCRASNDPVSDAISRQHIQVESIPWAGIIRCESVVVDLDSSSMLEEVGLITRGLLNKKAVAGWDMYSTSWIGGNPYRGLKFHVYQNATEDATAGPTIWTYACVYKSAAIKKLQAQRFLEKLMIATEHFRNNPSLLEEVKQDVLESVLHLQIREAVAIALPLEPSLELSREITTQNRAVMQLNAEAEKVALLSEKGAISSVTDGVPSSTIQTDRERSKWSKAMNSPTSVTRGFRNLWRDPQCPIQTQNLIENASEASKVHSSGVREWDGLETPSMFPTRDPRNFEWPETLILEDEDDDDLVLVSESLLNTLVSDDKNAKSDVTTETTVTCKESLLEDLLETTNERVDIVDEVRASLEAHFDDNASALTESPSTDAGDEPCFPCSFFLGHTKSPVV